MNDLEKILNHLEDTTYRFKVSLLSDEKKTVEFRPFRTEEQKILAVDKEEAKTDLDRFMVLSKLLAKCSLSKNTISLEDLTFQDYLWLLTNLRMKSLGERVVLKTNCKYCDFKENILTIDLEKDVVITPLKNLKEEIIEISKNLKFNLSHITMGDMVNILNYENDEDKQIASLASMIQTVELNEEILELNDIESKIKILNKLTKTQLEKFSNFLTLNDFGFKFEASYICGEKTSNPELQMENKGCGKENHAEIEGIDIIVFF